MGQKYAVFDEQGFPKAFYDKDIHGDKIPQDAIPITDDQWLEFINNQGRRKWDFETNQIVNYEPPQPSLDVLKQQKNLQLKQEVQDFIYSHYDQGEQASLLNLYQRAKEENNTEAISLISKVWSWIDTVLSYYFSKKEEIQNAESYEALDSITWDWSTVEETEHVSLKDIFDLFEH